MDVFKAEETWNLVKNLLIDFEILHLIDIDKLSEEELRKIKVNDGISEKHTYTSKMVSDIAGHSKSISERIFLQTYLSKIDYAISQSKKLNTAIDALIGEDKTEEAKMGNIGTNLHELFELLRTDKDL